MSERSYLRLDSFCHPCREHGDAVPLSIGFRAAVRALTPQAPESVFLRIAPGNQGFEFSLVTEPVPGDALIDDGKVQVFVEPQTAQLLDEQTLDTQLDEGG